MLVLDGLGLVVCGQSVYCALGGPFTSGNGRAEGVWGQEMMRIFLVFVYRVPL